jgi:diacylglycerol kinase family enzyme
MTRRRLAAIVALLAGAGTAVLAVLVAIEEFPRGLGVLACLLAAVVLALFGILRRGGIRALSLVAAALALAGAVALIVASGEPLAQLLVVAGLVLAVGSARAAFVVHVTLPPAPRPQRPVLFYNPRSGGGKAERFSLPEQARARGIEPIELSPGKDLVTLVRDAVAGGADGLAMAGGDGSQAIVAAFAAERGLPYACIPAGTRNHFALDLGVDRDDVVGALDAFVDGGERRVDLAEVNGRVFVNNVSLGLYAEAVQRAGYRDAKLRTLLDTAPDVLGPGGGSELSWDGPDGDQENAAAVVLVSNNRYRLGRAVGSGTRPRIDDGLLGITVLGPPPERGGRSQRPWREWSAPAFEIRAARPVPAGIDGEALTLEPPLRFVIRPGVLHVRIARAHPGASPSAGIPDGPWQMARGLARIAAGKASRPELETTTTTKEA